jgi:hypothetical protein
MTYPCFGNTPNAACAATPTYPSRECTSYVAWMGSQVLGKEWPTSWGDAMFWPDHAAAMGWTVNRSPAVGSVMCLSSEVNGAGSMGHVAWVIGVERNTVEVSEFNFLTPYGYDERDAPIAGAQFIHLPEPPQPPAPVPVPTEDDMVYLFNTGEPGIYCLYWGKYFHVTPDGLAAFEALAAKPIQTIGAAEHEILLATYGTA